MGSRFGRVALVSAVLLTGCGRHDVPPQSVPPDLIVYAGARDVRTAQRPGQIEVSYEVDQPFPATGLIATIDASLRGAGWQALQTDPLNPGNPSSQVVGWSSFVDERQKPNRTVHAWMSSWRSASGDLATYSFRYESPVTTADGFAVSSPSTSTMKVVGIHHSAKAASALIESSGRILTAAGQGISSGLSREDADVLKGIAESFPLRPSLINRSRPMCRGAIEDACVASQTIAWVKPLPGLVAAFSDRNRTSEDLPTLAGVPSVGPDAWTRPTNGPNPSGANAWGGVNLWCSLPGYSLGEAIVACMTRPAAAGKVQETVYVLELQGSWRLTLSTEVPNR
ncbi:MAG TPA: hypothetical protein VJN96_24250 [Vicinamibacterales bacterium]|nr:hypothetical protein [Vicinamibacterales bacterium]